MASIFRPQGARGHLVVDRNTRNSLTVDRVTNLSVFGGTECRSCLRRVSETFQLSARRISAELLWTIAVEACISKAAAKADLHGALAPLEHIRQHVQKVQAWA